MNISVAFPPRSLPRLNPYNKYVQPEPRNVGVRCLTTIPGSYSIPAPESWGVVLDFGPWSGYCEVTLPRAAARPAGKSVRAEDNGIALKGKRHC